MDLFRALTAVKFHLCPKREIYPARGQFDRLDKIG